MLLDLVEDFISTRGSVDALTLADFDDLSTIVDLHYEKFMVPGVGEGEYRAYPGPIVSNFFGAPDLRDQVQTALLYSHRLVVHDPLVAWLSRKCLDSKGPTPIRYSNGMTIEMTDLQGPAYWGIRHQPHCLSESRKRLTNCLDWIRPLSELLRSGTLIMVPHVHWIVKAYQTIVDQLKFDSKDVEFVKLCSDRENSKSVPTGDFHRGLVLAPAGLNERDRQRAIVAQVSFQMMKTFCVGAEASATFLPTVEVDWKLYDQYMRRLLEPSNFVHGRAGARVVAGVAAFDLPFLSGVDPATISSIRSNDQHFEDFRRQLRGWTSSIRADPTDEVAFRSEARQYAEDCVRPAALALADSVAKSSSLRDAAREAWIEVGLSAWLGLKLTGSPSLAVLTGGLPKAGRLLYKMLYGTEAPKGRARVLAKLMRKAGRDAPSVFTMKEGPGEIVGR